MEDDWKNLHLPLERPYRDDHGNHIAELLDITPAGEHIYEPKENASQGLGNKLRRIFAERGLDFFEKTLNIRTDEEVAIEQCQGKTDNKDDVNSTNNFMTMEELHRMRMEILPQLFISLGEISHARDLMASLLFSSQPAQSDPSNLSATTVSKPPPIISVQAFNSQLTIGSKDEALRKAADVFKSAAESMERGRIKDDKYWVDALKIRRGNWGLIPAPLPHGAATGKGTDRTSKDFLISYGLEEAPVIFRRKAIGCMPTYDTISDRLVFPQRHNTRLRVSVTRINVTGDQISSHNTLNKLDDHTLDGTLRAAQKEAVEQEIFSLLVQEAGSLPTASARVAERLVVIDAAQGTELRFELLDIDAVVLQNPDLEMGKEKCDLIYFSLYALLLRRHWYMKLRRLGSTGTNRLILPETAQIPPILRPIIDLLQYQVFCERIKYEMDKMVTALLKVGVPAKLRFHPVGETGRELIQIFNEDGSNVVGGEAVLTIDDRHVVRLTFSSPSSLTAHLPQATLTISSIPQLCQLLGDEIEKCLLQRICELGVDLCEPVGGTWFVDLNRCVGRWEGCVLNFHISYGRDLSINCSAFQLDKTTTQQGRLVNYSTTPSRPVLLLSWVKQLIMK
ncbi:subunit 17 of mediator complex-domain-containing protein, partial [Collybia nuda]